MKKDARPVRTQDTWIDGGVMAWSIMAVLAIALAIAAAVLFMTW